MGSTGKENSNEGKDGSNKDATPPRGVNPAAAVQRYAQDDKVRLHIDPQFVHRTRLFAN